MPWAMRTSALRVVLALLPAAASGAAVSAAQEMLECECDKVRCTCTKQCDCLVAREGYASFLQTMEVPVAWDGSGDDGATLLRSDDGEASAAFLQATEGNSSYASFLQATEGSASALMPAAGNEELLHCDCQKVRCNCLKRCECAMASVTSSGYMSAASAIQIHESVGSLPATDEEASSSAAASADGPQISRHRRKGAATA